jgi:hypothetical protein
MDEVEVESNDECLKQVRDEALELLTEPGSNEAGDVAQYTLKLVSEVGRLRSHVARQNSVIGELRARNKELEQAARKLCCEPVYGYPQMPVRIRDLEALNKLIGDDS